MELTTEGYSSHHIPGKNTILAADFLLVVAVREESFLGVDIYDLVGSALNVGTMRSFPDLRLILRCRFFLWLELNDLLLGLILTFHCHFSLFLFLDDF